MIHFNGLLRRVSMSFLAVTVLTTAMPAPAAAHGLAALPIAAVAPTLEGTVNLNTATAAELTLLPGIGPSTAAKIVAYRDKYPFAQALHLIRVKGVGRKTFAKLKPYVTVKGPTTLRKTNTKTKAPAKQNK